MNLAILLSTYNGEKYLSSQLDSILNQSFKNFTLYIRDDFSSDSTRLIIQEYQSKYNNIILIDDLNINIGANRSFYYLLDKVKADYYMFCDQDDIWLDNKIQIQIEEIKKLKKLQSKPVVIFHDLSLMNSKGDLIYNSLFSHNKIKIDNVTFESLFVKNIITGCTCIINNSMRDEMLKISPDKILMYDHLIALIAYGFGVPVFISKSLILYRDHAESVTPKIGFSVSYRIQNFIKNINNPNYLLLQILQLDEFLLKFKSKLSTTYVKNCTSFISLKRIMPFFRFFVLKSNSFFKFYN